MENIKILTNWHMSTVPKIYVLVALMGLIRLPETIKRTVSVTTNLGGIIVAPLIYIFWLVLLTYLLCLY